MDSAKKFVEKLKNSPAEEEKAIGTKEVDGNIGAESQNHTFEGCLLFIAEESEESNLSLKSTISSLYFVETTDRLGEEYFTQIDGNIRAESQAHAVTTCSHRIQEESDATNLLLEGSRGFSEIIDSQGDVDLIKSKSITRQISSKEQSLQKVDQQSSVAMHTPYTAGWPFIDVYGLNLLDPAGLSSLGHSGLPYPVPAGPLPHFPAGPLPHFPAGPLPHDLSGSRRPTWP
ncbi:hypothetical protein CDAR_380291 [Caerostris darwini]|uniref:Uncharacterized protein n=1 Tax=Caerostris darwini TaxID=1538125 RepID=A0AAV4TL40_9ARAC|nr:hypothetical protein CDAR_380291 [Caerostris darwini]